MQGQWYSSHWDRRLKSSRDSVDRHRTDLAVGGVRSLTFHSFMCYVLCGAVSIGPHLNRPPTNGHSMRVLLVEDEKKVASFVARALREDTYAVDVAENGHKALEL